MIFDVDGVLTDGSLYYSSSGEGMQSFHTLDGYGLQLLAQAGIRSAIISGRSSDMVKHRAAELGIEHIYQGVKHKPQAFAQLLTETQLSAEYCGYMGDDWPDLGVMQQVAFAACPPSAHPEVIRCSHYQTKAQAGRGAVREICDFILRAQGHYATLLTRLS
jgi:3-deoxy-D-manno-octulosonate 8-phosphate phosphatase (KDO 8-P phosphatase)